MGNCPKGIITSLIPSFCLRDKSVHLHECSPFWVGIFIILKKKFVCLLIYVDKRILIGKLLKHLYML